MIRARIKAAMAVKKSRREFTGVAPYGFRVGPDGKTLVPHEEERAIIDQIRRWRESGLSLRSIQSRATETGLLSRKRTPFTVLAIRHMLSRSAV